MIKKIGAVPVVDEHSKIIANFSMSDLRGMGRKDFGDLLLTVDQYLQKRKEQHVTYERSLVPITVTENETLEQVVYKVVATRVHRVWLVDSANRVIGCVSLSDLMKAFL